MSPLVHARAGNPVHREVGWPAPLPLSGTGRTLPGTRDQTTPSQSGSAMKMRFGNPETACPV